MPVLDGPAPSELEGFRDRALNLKSSPCYMYPPRGIPKLLAVHNGNPWDEGGMGLNCRTGELRCMSFVA
jgi:hypothetical protein